MKDRGLIEVGCAVIAGARSYPLTHGKILIAQRKPGDSFGGFWEFPGGRLEDGEDIEGCLVREVEEELSVRIRPRKKIRVTEHLYPGRRLRLHFYLCDYLEGRPVCRDCLGFQWVAPAELRRFRFPAADDVILQDLIRNQSVYFPR